MTAVLLGFRRGLLMLQVCYRTRDSAGVDAVVGVAVCVPCPRELLACV